MSWELGVTTWSNDTTAFWFFQRQCRFQYFFLAQLTLIWKKELLLESKGALFHLLSIESGCSFWILLSCSYVLPPGHKLYTTLKAACLFPGEQLLLPFCGTMQWCLRVCAHGKERVQLCCSHEGFPLRWWSESTAWGDALAEPKLMKIPCSFGASHIFPCYPFLQLRVCLDKFCRKCPTAWSPYVCPSHCLLYCGLVVDKS